jgi:hypothetical protein
MFQIIIDTAADYCKSDKICEYIKSVVTLSLSPPPSQIQIINNNSKSWTGSRVGVIAAKAWAFGLNIPIKENSKIIDIHELQPFYDKDFIIK